MRLKLRGKLVLYVTLISIVTYIIVVGYINTSFRNKLLESSKDVINQYAIRNANESKAILNRDLGVAQAMGSLMENFVVSDSAFRTQTIERLLTGVLNQDSRYYSTWVSLELQTYDPNWTKSYGRRRFTYFRQGPPKIEFVNTNGDDVNGTYYRLKTHPKEEINDPYYFSEYNDKNDARNNMFGTSVCVPLMHNSKFAGLIGMDFTLEIFDYISSIKPHATSSTFLVANNGTIVTHENKDLIGKNVTELLNGEQDEVIRKIKEGTFSSGTTQSIKGIDEAYMIIAPITFGTSGYPWAMVITVPMGELVKETNRIFWLAVLLGLIGLVVLIVVLNFIGKRIASPITESARLLGELAQGKIDVQNTALTTSNNDELGEMSRSIAVLIENLRQKMTFAENIGAGRLEVEMETIKADDKLGKALIEMRDNLRLNNEQNAIRNWGAQGLASFSEVLRLNASNKDFYFSIISYLVKYLKANQGGIFIMEEEEGEKFLSLKGTYAFDKKKFIEKKIAEGNGLLGQCVLEGQPIYLKQVPPDYIHITSGLGGARPSVVLIVPLKSEENIVGVMEIASFGELKDYEIDFVSKVSESIASTIVSYNITIQTKELLEISRQKEEELRAAEEEMRQNMEELEATQEEMGRMQKGLQETEKLMRSVINGTDDSIVVFDKDYKIVLINDVLKKRYHGTDFQMDVGDNILEKLGAHRAKWEDKYKQVLSGEKLEFTIKSLLEKETTYRYYYMIPVFNDNSTVKYCIVVTRDEKVKHE